MLLGAKFVKAVLLWREFKPTSPRDADTAFNPFLEVCYVPAVFEPPCRLGKRFSIQRALSRRIVEMCSRHSLASFLVALLTSFVKNSYQLFFAPHPL